MTGDIGGETADNLPFESPDPYGTEPHRMTVTELAGLLQQAVLHDGTPWDQAYVFNEDRLDNTGIDGFIDFTAAASALAKALCIDLADTP